MEVVFFLEYKMFFFTNSVPRREVIGWSDVNTEPEGVDSDTAGEGIRHSQADDARLFTSAIICGLFGSYTSDSPLNF